MKLKTSLQLDQMAEAGVEHAHQWTKHMVHTESRCPGDHDNALKRLEGRYGVKLWAFLYRKPKDIGLATYNKLRAAYLAHCERVARRELQMIEIEKMKGAADADLEGLLADASAFLEKVQAKRLAQGKAK